MKESSSLEHLPETSSENWRDTTQQDCSPMTNFLKNFMQIPIEERPRYDSLTELHFSGTNTDTNEEIANGKGNILSVKRFPNNENPQQIHVVFDGKKMGHNIDVYLKGIALQDYLKSIQENKGDN